MSNAHSKAIVYGMPNSDLKTLEINGQELTVHKEVVKPLTQLLGQLDNDGLTAKVVSHWRSFDHQCSIWTAKWQGKRALLDRNECPLQTEALSNEQKFDALCFWSAIPGLSRHHWGTDFDIFLAKPMAEGYQPQLIPSEFSSEGPAASLEVWLDKHLTDFAFYRPYQDGFSGVSPEPWHISYYPVATEMLKKVEATEVASLIKHSKLPEKNFIVERLERYIADYVEKVAPLP